MNSIVSHCLPPRKPSQAFMKAMAVWDHSLVFMAAKPSYVDGKVLGLRHNCAKWLFHFCHLHESSCPGIKAASAGKWWWH